MPPKMLRPQGGSAHTSGIFADMTVDGPIIGDLVVVVDRARNLPNRKTMGKQDPYCAARLGKEAKKTETDRRGGQTPKWDQELRFVVHESPDYLKLKLSIFNEDRKTELIGETWIELKDVIVRGGGQHDGWHRLNCKGRPSGEVRMEITFYDTREKPADAPVKPSRQTEKPHGGPRELPIRRPLPRGPGGEATAPRGLAPHSASTSHIPSRPHLPPEAAMPRHMSTDATEQGLVDPYKHRQKMLAIYGLPYDPSAQADDERLTHHGGPRPVPGQSFSDLDRLRYRNRGVAIPEGLIQEDNASRSRRNTYESPLLPQIDTATQIAEEQAHDFHPGHSNFQPQAQPQTYLHDSQPTDHFHPSAPQSYDHFDDIQVRQDQTSHHQPYVEPYVEEEDEGPPPPPPVHRSHVGRVPPAAPPVTHLESGPSPASFQHSLAQLNSLNDDDFYNPMENTTQLTTHSDMAAPGHIDGYNHGHRPSPRTSHGPNGYSPSHQRSMQDMRSSGDGRYNHYDTPTRHSNRTMQRMSYNARNDTQDDFRSSGPPPPVDLYAQSQNQLQLHRSQGYDSGYDSIGQDETPHSYSPHQVQHARSNSSFQNSPIDPYPERHSHSSRTPIVKPRAISPNMNSPHYQVPSQPSTPQYTPNPASTTPTSIARKSVEPRISDNAFSPDSFDVLNPQVKSRPSTGNPDTMIQSPYANDLGTNNSTPTHSPGDPIRDSSGRLVDPSDHLPTHTWAPEPEPKKPLKAEVKLRFKGAVPMPAAAPRSARPNVQMPPVNSSVFSPHLTEKPGDLGSDSTGKEGRSRLQKKVRVMMTSGGRRERKAEKEAARMEENIAWAAGSGDDPHQQPLRDLPSVNYSSRQNAPALPAKVPIDVPDYEENEYYTAGLGNDALSRELSNIDLGAYGGRGSRGSRFATTLM